jgi:hypothetical protein
MRDHELDQLRAEARYRRERLDLYRARRYGGRPGSAARLNELQRSADLAAERLRHAEAAGGTTPRPA